MLGTTEIDRESMCNPVHGVGRTMARSRSCPAETPSRPPVLPHKPATSSELVQGHQSKYLGATEHVWYTGIVSHFVPEGPLKIAQHFSAGLTVSERSTSPRGTTETLRNRAIVPYRITQENLRDM